MKFHLSVLMLYVAVTHRLATGGDEGAVPIGDASFVAQQLGTIPGATCTSHGDVILLVDRSAGQSKEEFGTVKDFLKRLLEIILESGLGDCYRTALVSFSKKAKVEYDFTFLSIDEAFGIIDGMKNPKGQGFTNAGLMKAVELFENDENPSPGGNRVVVLFTDGSSNDKTATLEAAANLKSTTSAKVLIGKRIDPNAVSVQQLNRDGEINGILANSVCGSGLIYSASLLDGPLPDILVSDTFNALTSGGADCLQATEFLGSGVSKSFCPRIPDLPPPKKKYLCKPELLTKYGRRDGFGNIKKCIGLYIQRCLCEENADGEIVPKVDGACLCDDVECPIGVDKDGTLCCVNTFTTKECPLEDCQGIPGEGSNSNPQIPGDPPNPEDPPKVTPGPSSPSFRSDNVFLCHPRFKGYGMDSAGKWIRLFTQDCGCYLNDDGCIVPFDDQTEDCDCTSEGCPLAADGRPTNLEMYLPINETEHKELEESKQSETITD